MVRGTWNAREPKDGQDDLTDEDHEEKEVDEEQAKSSANPLSDHSHINDGVTVHGHPWNDGPLVEDEDGDDGIGAQPELSVDDLAASMDTLSLVPTAIRFGRGAKRGGLSHHQHPSGPRRGQPHPHASQRADSRNAMEVVEDGRAPGDHHMPRGRGRGPRGDHGDATEGQTRRGRPPIMPRGLGMAHRAGYMGRGRIAFGIARGGEARGRGAGQR